MSSAPKIACFGEILWDVFPNKQLLGGAPLNVAMRLNGLGAKVYMISSVGNDAQGTRALQHIEATGLGTGYIGISERLPTGTVKVTIANGIPSYVITENVAWDNISVAKETLEKLWTTDALVFGSLALRGKHNRSTLNSLLERSRLAVFDLNLRAPYYDSALLTDLMNRSHFLKMNDEELEYVCDFLKIQAGSLDSKLTALAEKTNTNTICVTLGSEGAILLFEGHYYRNKGYEINVSDTVGAGDSFLAGLLYGILSGDGPENALASACALGALVASKEGANCTVTEAEIRALIA